jgi:hypothetical protein
LLVIGCHQYGGDFLKAHAPGKDKSGDKKDSFCEKLEHLINFLRPYYMKILLGDFSPKVGREDIFKPTIGTRLYLKLVIMELE